ncbi:Nipped-B-like protein pqn-85 [Frankliniella fusca]|uniref:Nipped-B-like protein pqn-85 n=1 Tax=Frankliniella fusca TaxID=407009 RepID=A0AAE1HJR6_9NEOP|nr:Nipped-B-like protein pqn-85 [Frankliniella fusca]
MTLQATSTDIDAVGAANSVPRTESLCGTPSQLKDGVHTFMSLAKTYPDLHPAVLAAILAQPASERPALLEAARGTAPPPPAPQQPGSPPPASQQGKCPAVTLTPCSDSDDVWEDAVGSPVKVHKTPPPAAAAAVPVASEVVDVPGEGELQRLEREAAECHRAWQRSRQLSHWMRYNDCRNRIRQLRRPDTKEVDRRFAQLQALREMHERRLAELVRRRERLLLSKRYHEQTRAHLAQLAQAQLKDKLRELEERAQARRLKHLQRLQELVSELSLMDQQDSEAAAAAAAAGASGSRKKADAPPPVNADSSIDEFTHVWDDFSHWEKMVSDDDKENEEPVDDESHPTSQSPVGTRPAAPAPAPAVPPRPLQSLITNQPDLIPQLPPAPGHDGPWRSTLARSLMRSSSCSSAGPWRSPDSGFEERKKWFEEALNSWHGQDEEEFSGATLYPATYFRGRLPQDRAVEQSPQWYQAAWKAWQGPADSFH